jgi:phosphatidylserine decarboxylase
MIQTIYRLFIELTNRKSTSIMLAKFTKSKMSRMMIPSFSKVYKIDQAEMEKPIDEYATLHEFFTRKLKKGSRIIYQDPVSVVSPVDATIEEMGMVSSDYTFTVKGKSYTISEMLGDDEKVKKYLNGTYIIFYLSPSNYHRIHSPVSGKVTEQWALGTKSYPLNKYGLKYGKKPFSKNYRMITEIDYNNTSIAIVKVGAMFINSIERLDTGDELEKGTEIAYFSFGSSIVLLFEGGSFAPAISKSIPCQIKMGERIGYINTESKTLVE